jgi:hypothetical protein
MSVVKLEIGDLLSPSIAPSVANANDPSRLAALMAAEGVTFVTNAHIGVDLPATQ